MSIRFDLSEQTRGNLYEIAAALRAATAASRTTIRLAAQRGRDYPVVAEALGSGVKSLIGQPVVRRPRESPGPLEFIEANRAVLVQDDVCLSPPAFPEIVEVYGVRAQMLAPVIDGESLLGLVSVHNASVRAWTPEDIDALEHAAGRVSHVVTGIADRGPRLRGNEGDAWTT
jgi:maleate isomerase